jgi:hypothetical protein
LENRRRLAVSTAVAEKPRHVCQSERVILDIILRARARTIHNYGLLPLVPHVRRLHAVTMVQDLFSSGNSVRINRVILVSPVRTTR